MIFTRMFLLLNNIMTIRAANRKKARRRITAAALWHLLQWGKLAICRQLSPIASYPFEVAYLLAGIMPHAGAVLLLALPCVCMRLWAVNMLGKMTSIYPFV
jgi:hypothetical protein